MLVLFLLYLIFIFYKCTYKFISTIYRTYSDYVCIFASDSSSNITQYYFDYI